MRYSLPVTNATSSGTYTVTANVIIDGDLDVTGDISSEYVISDQRLKDIREDITNACTALEDIRAVKFTWTKEAVEQNPRFPDGIQELGLLAQEVQQHYPEIVTLRKDRTYLKMDYQGMVPVLVAAIKELHTRVKELENK